MSAGCTLDTSGFNRMIGDLVNIAGPGTNADAAMRGEIGSFLDVCVRYTTAASVGKIRERANYRFESKYALRGSGDLKVTFNDGLGNGGSRGGDAVAENVWLRSGGKFHIMRGPGVWVGGKRQAPNGARWPDWLWAQYQSLIEQTPEERAALKKAWIERALKSRGLAKASWSQIAGALGVTLKSLPGFAENPAGSDGKFYLNGTSLRTANASSLTYTLQNAMPALALGGGLNGEGIATRALATRETAFAIALEKGVFADIEQVAKRYPGLLAV